MNTGDQRTKAAQLAGVILLIWLFSSCAQVLAEPSGSISDSSTEIPPTI